ncbi:MAG: 5-histidylcysteine sulfoxide synthase [Alphaproteobacteria bacterium]|nr:5-histidylcysteine sulfoxide synthase [Alphaproteobacteria bacterium]QQS58076.1 MAG: 5-histidylcysteine sulfoxide synthase [Alphaproteobacteria bacterium]
MAAKTALAHAPEQTIEDLLVTRTVNLHGADPEAKRREILEYFEKSFTLYESLFECLNGEEAFYARANTLRHPLIFYYGHTSVLFINKLNVAKLIDKRIDPRLESMLAIGVDEMSWDDLNEAHYDWPTPAEVKAYRGKTREVVRDFIMTCDVSLPIGWDSPLWVIMLGIEHERIHLETSAVLIRELPLKYVKPHPVWSRICRQSGAAPENSLLAVKGGPLTLGKGRDNPYYGWDNEYGRLETTIPDFKASKYLVSNGEYLGFVNDGGYETREFWDEEGWNWVTFKQAKMPVYWRKEGDKYRYRSMLEEIDMPWDWPVDVNCLEARAFCKWKAKMTGKPIRLPTEPEWAKLRELLKTDQPDWDRAPGNINLEGEMSPCPVNRHEGPGGFFDIIGNVWQWTETPIDAYEGFEVHPVYDDFSTPTFDGKHNVFKGGCWISTGNYAIKDSRYAFRRHFFQYSGIRYVEAGLLPEQQMNIYETDAMVAMYIEFHYGREYFGVPNFPVACARAALEAVKGGKTRKALDIGCATGRSAFELAKLFDHVDALDFSARLIQAPTHLQQRGIQRYVVQDEGEIVSFREIKIEDFGYQDVKDKILFAQADACNLLTKYSGYDLVFAGNLIDRLYDPKKFLTEIKDRINPGGLLILTSPYTWLPEFTEREKWLGGFKARTGENYTTLEGINDALAPEFERVGEPRDIPFVLRETSRKFQHTLAQFSVWRKKDV